MLRTGVAVRRSEERGTTRTDWLLSRHSFSFADYQDPAHMGFGPLRVLNDDLVQPGAGFGPHAHRDMEIVTYVLEGALEHRDSTGNEGTIRAGEAQFMRAGSGVVHSEMNASATEPVHFLQVWFRPRARGRAPAYAQQRVEFPARGGWATVARPEEAEGESPALPLDADALLLAIKVPAGGRAGHVVHAGRQCYLFVIEGEAALGGERLRTGDAALVRDGVVGVRSSQPSHLLLFDLPLA